jgi:hypothetical protein
VLERDTEREREIQTEDKERNIQKRERERDALLQTHVVDLPLANYLAQTCFFFLFRKR